jgi:hypothetical protein
VRKLFDSYIIINIVLDAQVNKATWLYQALICQKERQKKRARFTKFEDERITKRALFLLRGPRHQSNQPGFTTNQHLSLSSKKII